jgi:predicted ATPase/DNA-binding NarL/FixJ family response regulator
VGGRRDELELLRQRLSGPDRLVTLTGPGGIGKTWIARQLAAQPGRGFRSGTRLVPLGDVRDPALLACTVAGALGLRLEAPPGDVSGLVALLADRQALLVLDRCEHLLPDSARFVAQLLQGCRMLRILVTSREPLRVAGERVVLVPPLSVPRDSGADPATAMGHDAVALFVERATAVAPDFRLTQDNVAPVCALCARLDGNPLALELAAARVGLLGPQALLDRLDTDRYRLLTAGVRATSPQLPSLRASVEASWDLCTDQQRALWARLTVFPADFDLDAVEAVCSGEGIEKAEVLDLVDSLLEKSVLNREAEPATVRYSMSETLRAYGAERLDPAAGRLVSDRYLRWCRRIAEDAAEHWFGPAQSTWVRRLRREHVNLRAALDWATSDPARAPDVLRMVGALEPWWVLTGRVTEARHWLAAAQVPGSGTPDERGEALARAAWLACTQGDLDEARDLLDEALQLRPVEAPTALWAVARARGGLEAVRGRVEEADRLLRQSVDLAVGAGRSAEAAEGWLLLGLSRLLAGREDVAEEALHRCVVLTDRAGESQLRAWALGLRALGALDRGRTSTARAWAEEALASKADVGDRVAVPFLSEVLAWVATAEEDPARAAVLLGAAGRMWRAVGPAPLSLGRLELDRQQRLDAVRKTLGGRAFAQHTARGAALSDQAVVRYARSGALAEPTGAPTSAPLTTRELVVAEHVARGLSNREIAGALVISVRTVQGHVESILRKLRFTSRSQIAAWVARRHGEDPPDPTG